MTAARLAVVLAALSATRAFAADTPSLASRIADTLSPDFVPVHCGGYQGFLAAGAGYQVGEAATVDTTLGFVPRAIGGHDILQATAKIAATLVEAASTAGWRASLFLGTGLTYGFSDKLFLLLPDKYPAGYYPPSAFRLLLLSGLRYRGAGPHEFVFEYTWLDSQLERYYEDGVYENFFKIGTYGVGYRYWIQADG